MLQKSRTRRQEMKIQEGQLFTWLKEGALLSFEMITGKKVRGRILRFDRYVLLLNLGGKTMLVYKSAIACIMPVGDEIRPHRHPPLHRKAGNQ